MKERTKAYLAGLLDAEGHCAIVKAQCKDSTVYSTRLGIVNTFRPIIEWLVSNFGGSYRIDKPIRPAHHKVAYQWYPEGRSHMAKVLTHAIPYLQIKKRQAQLLLQSCELNGQRVPEVRKEIFDQVWALNSSSVTTESPSFPWKNNLINAYFAGFFDGEGTISISKKFSKDTETYYYVLNVRIGCTAQKLMAEMTRIYGGNFSSYVGPNPKHKTVFYWDASSHDVQERFLLKMLPYLKIKREQARLALNLIRLHHRKDAALREQFYLEMRHLKEQGKMRQSELTGDSESAPAGTLTA